MNGRKTKEGSSSPSSSPGSGTSNVKKGCISFQECLGYCKAFLLGKAKMLMARNEREAAAADLQTSKMQVEAADAAEEKKRRLHPSN